MLLIGLFLLLIPRQASALSWFTDFIGGEIVQGIIEGAIQIIFLFLNFFVGIIQFVTGVLASVFTAFLSWVMQIVLEVDIIESDAVVKGWKITRDLANMIFAVVLAFIGLAEILQIPEYDYKKTVPKLIMIIFLINFSLVAVGFVVDMSNIVTKFFVDEATSGDGITILSGQEAMKNSGAQALQDAMQSETSIFQVTKFVDGIVSIIFNISVVIIMLLIVLLLVQRILYLWMLAVLAPIAFLSYTIPSDGKGILSTISSSFFVGILGWKKWWESLLKWAMVGILLSFFIYLSTLIAGMDAYITLDGSGDAIGFPVGETVVGGEPTEDITTTVAALLQALMVPMFSLFFLLEGYKLAKKTLPEESTTIINQVSQLPGKVVGAAVGIAAGVATGGAAMIAGGAASTLKAGATSISRRAGKKLDAWGQAQQEGAKGIEGRGATIRKWGKRAIGIPASMLGSELKGIGETQETKRINDTKTKLVDLPREQTENRLRLSLAGIKLKKAGSLQAAIAAMEVLHAKGNLGKAQEANIFSDEDYVAITKRAQATGRKELATYKPELSAAVAYPDTFGEGEKMIKRGEELKNSTVGGSWVQNQRAGEAMKKEGKAKIQEAVDQIMEDIKTDKFKDISESSFSNEYVAKSVVTKSNGAKFAAIATNFGKDAAAAIQKEISGFTSQELAKINPSAYLYLISNGAQALGYTPPPPPRNPPTPQNPTGTPYTIPQHREMVREARKATRDEKEIERGDLWSNQGIMLLRDMLAKDISKETKATIKSALRENLSGRMPSEREIKSLIGGLHNKIEKLDSDVEENAWKARKERDVLNRLNRAPGTSPRSINRQQSKLDTADERLLRATQKQARERPGALREIRDKLDRYS